jgi:hypothetical protein
VRIYAMSLAVGWNRCVVTLIPLPHTRILARRHPHTALDLDLAVDEGSR